MEKIRDYDYYSLKYDDIPMEYGFAHITYESIIVGDKLAKKKITRTWVHEEFVGWKSIKGQRPIV